MRSDGRKSKQLDIIVVRNEATGTMYGSRQGEPELVRAECVAAVGEVKSSWYGHKKILRSYAQMVHELEVLQDGLLIRNHARFGNIEHDTPIHEMTRPVTGRVWLNRCYTFIVALGIGKCNLKNLAHDLSEAEIRPSDAAALILDADLGGVICLPCRTSQGRNVIGMQCEINRNADEAESANRWEVLQETFGEARVAAGRMLHLFLSDLQSHLSTWTWEFRDPRPYVRLSEPLRRRHPDERS